MCMGKEKLEFYMAEIRKKGDAASKKSRIPERICVLSRKCMQEVMILCPLIFTGQGTRFQIIEGKLMPSIDSIEGLGDKAADAVVDAAVQGRFLSRMISVTEPRSAKP